jgi:SAM-dependent methyltransferase
LTEHTPPIAEIARVLAPGGRFVFLLNHPLLQAPNSGGVIDHDLDEQYWRVGAYLPVDVTMEELAPGVILPFVHRPLSQYVNSMAAVGLVIRRMEEPRPPDGFLARAKEYRDAADIPRLLLLLAERVSR